MIPYHISSTTGLSQWENKGAAGSFKFGQSLDVRKTIDSMSCQQALTDDLAAGTMTGLTLFIVASSDGNTYLLSNTGQIWRRNSSGAYSLVYTDTNGAITGAAEWSDYAGNTYLYWTTATALNCKKLLGASYSPAEPWTDVNTAIPIQGGGTTTFPKTLTSTPWHICRVVNGRLLIGNASNLAYVGYDNSYTNAALGNGVTPGDLVKTIIERNTNAVIGTYPKAAKQDSDFFLWDTIQSTNWNSKKTYKTTPINAMIDTEYALAQVGAQGQIYLSDFQNLQPIISFPGGGYCYPDGVTADNGLALFGIMGNSKQNGVFSFGRNRKDANPVLNLEYPLTCDEIGSIKKIGTDILVSYRSGTSYGIKRVDTANKATGIYQSLDLTAPLGTRRYPIHLTRVLGWNYVLFECSPLPAGCAVEVWYRVDKKITQYTLPNGTLTDANGWIQANQQDGTTQYTTTGGTEAMFQIQALSRIFEVMFKLIPSGNATPEIHEYNVYFEVS